MIHPNKQTRSAILALAVIGAAPLAGASIPLVGVTSAQAQAQEQLIGSILFEGNRRFSDDQLTTIAEFVDGLSEALSGSD